MMDYNPVCPACGMTTVVKSEQDEDVIVCSLCGWAARRVTDEPQEADS